MIIPLVILAAVACRNDDVAPPRVDATAPVSRLPLAAQASGRLALLAGEFELVTAAAFGDPGFHQVITLTADMPTDLGRTGGLRMVLKLRDAVRSGQTCSQEHPLSGCATVDWSDAVGRPGVPSSGVFKNSIVLELGSGRRTVFLSEAGTLEDAPDVFKPG